MKVTTNGQSFWRAGKLGAINGLLFGALVELLLRVRFEYSKSQLASSPQDGDLIFEMSPYPFDWWYIPFLSFALVIPASLIVHRYLAPQIKSPIWLWQVIGFVAVVEFYLLTLGRDVWYAQFSVMGSDSWQFAWSIKLTIWLFLITISLIFNLIFGLIIRYVKCRASEMAK